MPRIAVPATAMSAARRFAFRIIVGSFSRAALQEGKVRGTGIH
jgi:hypothetical protein